MPLLMNFAEFGRPAAAIKTTVKRASQATLGGA